MNSREQSVILALKAVLIGLHIIHLQDIHSGGAMKIATTRKTILILFLSPVLPLLTAFYEFLLHPAGNTINNVHDPIVKTIVIDPGHGGKDPGCSGRHTIEKEIALSISLRLGEMIKAQFPEVKVIFTRTTDVFIPLDERAHIANRAEADLFISIHCNYVSKRNQAQGSETYVMGLHKAEDNLDVAKRENAAILMEDNYVQRYDGYDPDSPEGHIILSMYQNAHLEQSILFADFIEKQFTKGLARKSRGVKQAGFLVLRNTTMPSVLIEAGFLSHDTDEAFLATKENHEHMARAILRAFSEYKAHVEGYVADLEELVASTSAPPSASEPVITLPPPANEPADPVLYYVQLAASKTELKADQMKWSRDVQVDARKENGYYKYLAGPFADTGEANVVLREMRAGCCKDAFVVAYRDGQRISMNAAAGPSQ
jgi:N-acetylmuramoyl-L-alanine amidase